MEGILPMASKSNDKQQDLRFTLAQLEALSTHQIADLLSNLVLILRRLPDVAISELQPGENQPVQEQKGNSTSGDDLVSKARERVNAHGEPVWWTGKE
jgi:hypothetical protein